MEFWETLGGYQNNIEIKSYMFIQILEVLCAKILMIKDKKSYVINTKIIIS